MKLTWFGGTTFRLHVGGTILVCDPAGLAGVDAAELVSGADRVFGLGDELPAADPAVWQPRRAPALLEDAAVPEVEVWRLAPGVVLVDAVGEPPLVIATEVPGRAGRWGRDAVVVVLGADVAAVTASALEMLGPRLLAVGAPDDQLMAALELVRDRLDGTGFVALEPGMALEA